MPISVSLRSSPRRSFRRNGATLAVGRVLLGLTVATIVGVPLANWLGQAVGWRWGFAIVAALALTVRDDGRAACASRIAPIRRRVLCASSRRCAAAVRGLRSASAPSASAASSPSHLSRIYARRCDARVGCSDAVRLCGVRCRNDRGQPSRASVRGQSRDGDCRASCSCGWPWCLGYM